MSSKPTKIPSWGRSLKWSENSFSRFFKVCRLGTFIVDTPRQFLAMITCDDGNLSKHLFQNVLSTAGVSFIKHFLNFNFCQT